MSNNMFTDGSPASASDDDWISVFQQRGVWQLTPEIIQRWISRNASFFSMISRYVPDGASLLELGCGPGRHGLSAAMLGYRVVGIDIDPRIVAQAQANARAVVPDCDVAFRVADMFNLGAFVLAGEFQAITHGGLMEHLPSADSIRQALREQLIVVPNVIFDVPVSSVKNQGLFGRDNIFRQLWTADQWVDDVLEGLHVIETHTELHSDDNMTDDLVIALGR